VSHVGLTGNSAANTAAKAALLKTVINLTLPHCDYDPPIRTHVQVIAGLMESRNSEQTPCRRTDGEPYKGVLLPRPEEIIMHRLQIEHTYMADGYLLKWNCPPQCNVCQTRHTVECVLLHCTQDMECNPCESFHACVTNPSCIIDFIKEFCFYRRIK